MAMSRRSRSISTVLRNRQFPGDRQNSQVSDQIVNTDIEGVRHNFQRVNGHIAFTAFDFADVRAVQPGTVGENILRPAPLHTQGPNVRPNFFLNLLHSSQFGRTLVKSIQVISCIARASSRRCARVFASPASF
jgi:hypothetical protein